MNFHLSLNTANVLNFVKKIDYDFLFKVCRLHYLYLSCVHSSLECKVLLCDFHREQAWERWLNLTANGARLYKGVVLAYLRRIANSESENSYLKNVEELQDSDIWNLDQNKKLREWISKTWLPCHEVKYF